jgi:heme-degrading monooxygenase HmoA
MKRKGTVIVMYDAPMEADLWMHGPHYDEVNATPGVIGVRRYEIEDGPEGCRRYIALIESDDVDATLAWRSSAAGKRSQEEADARGVSNRYAMVGRCIYSSVPGEAK